MIEFINSHKTISENDLLKFEKIFELSLPIEYKKQILISNGGEPGGEKIKDIFFFTEKNKRTSSRLRNLYAFGGDKNVDIFSSCEIFKSTIKRMPKHIVPIGEDSFGNQICLSCGEKDYGCVYFWDHENEVDYSVSDDNDYSNLYLIANSFQEFLDSLISEEDYLNQNP